MGLCLIALSGVVLAGRFTGHAAWVRWLPDGAPMAFPTAVCFGISGLAFLVLTIDRLMLARIGGAFVFLMGGSTLGLYALAAQIGWGDYGFASSQMAAGLGFDGRMSPNIASAFALLGSALMLISTAREWTRTLSVLGAAILTIGAMGFSNYLLGLGPESVWWRVSGMAVHSAGGLMMVGAFVMFCAGRRVAQEMKAMVQSISLFSLAAGLAFVVGVASYLSHQQLAETSALVVNAHEVRGAIDRIVAEVARMESSARGYALTGAESFRKRVDDHRQEVDAGLRELGQLTVEDREQDRRVERLRELAAEKISIAAEMVRVRAELGSAAAQALLAQQPQTSGSALVNLTDEMREVESRQLKHREQVWQNTRRAAKAVQLTAGGLAFVLVLLAYAFEARASAARSRAERELRELNEQLEQRVRERTEALEYSLREVTERERSRRFLADAVPQLIWTSRADGTSESVNRRYTEFTGIKPDETDEARWLEVVHPDDRAQVRDLWHAIQASGREGGGEYRMRRASDGTYRWMTWWARPERDAEGRLVRWVGATNDVHDLKMATEQLEQTVRERTSELAAVMRLQRAVLDGNPFSIIATDCSGLIEIFNRGAERMLGYTATELVGRAGLPELHLRVELQTRAAELTLQFNRRVADDLEVLFARARAGGLDERDWLYVAKDGSHVPVRVSVAPLRDEQGAIRGFVAIGQDLTQRRRTEMALEVSEKRLLEVIGKADCLLWEAQVRTEAEPWHWHYVVQPSAMYRRLFGAEPLATGDDLWARFEVPEQQEREMRSRHAISRGLLGYEQEFRVRHGGREIWLRETVSISRSDAGACWLVGVVTDVTERKRLEFEMRGARDLAVEASRLKSEFLANVSHEIRTPMNGVIGMTELLLETPLHEDQREMAQVVRRSAENLLTIINDLLDFSKIEAGKLRIATEEFELRPQLEANLALLTPPAAAKGLRIDLEIDPALPEWVRGDAGRVQQVLTNLVGNAVKFTERGGVRVVWRAAGPDRARCEVHDTGAGIPADYQGKLFQAFVQVDGSNTRRHGGTGLGLAISRQLVELMDGRIGFTSEPGRGSVFWFEISLPAVERIAPLAKSTTAPVVEPASIFRLHFLVVEDAETNQIVARSLLELHGHTCEIAENGTVALTKLAQSDFDAVLMDCQMPEKDGYTVTREIRAGAVPGRERIPIIALTAYALPEDRARCLACGMDDYLAKPLRVSELTQAIRRLSLGHPRSVALSDEASAPAPAAVAETVLDPAQVAQLRDLPGRTRPTLLQEVAALLQQAAPQTIAELRVAAAAADLEQVQLLAHRLAGSCAHLGALRMRRRALTLEQVAPVGDPAAIEEALAHLEAEWPPVHQALRDILA